VVIGGGLVGIEIACEMRGRLRTALGADVPVRTVLIDHGAIGHDMGEGRGVITDALTALDVEVRPKAGVVAVDAGGVLLASGERIPAATVIFATGMRASAGESWWTRSSRWLAWMPCTRRGIVPARRLTIWAT
jgi:NADH dehydrogenase